MQGKFLLSEHCVSNTSEFGASEVCLLDCTVTGRLQSGSGGSSEVVLE